MNGRRAADVVRSISTRKIRDPKVSGMTVEAFLNEAVRRLAEEAECFRRHEIIPTVANQAEYALSGEVKRILKVSYDGDEIAWCDEETLYRFDGDWRTATGPTPRRWTNVATDRIRVAPIPTGAGTALVWSGGASITSAEGHRVAGADYYLGQDGGDRFFLPSDGTCTNPEATGNLLVHLAYYPTDLDADTVIPHRFIPALESLTAFLVLSEAADGQTRAATHWNDYLRLLGGTVPPPPRKRRSLAGEAIW